MNTALLSLGSNVGNSSQNIILALADINNIPGITIESLSSLYQTKPVGFLEQDDFINAACVISTTLEPSLLLETLLKLEQKYKRVRLFKDGPRTLDIDLIAYDSLIQDSAKLMLPHPRMHKRAFVLAPLDEICPDFVISKFNKTIHELYEELDEKEKQGVKKLNAI